MWGRGVRLRSELVVRAPTAGELVARVGDEGMPQHDVLPGVKRVRVRH